MGIEIVKRDGERVPFNIVKIKKALEWACEGNDVNQLELESKVHLNIKHGMSTSQVQQTLISTALNMTNIDNFKNLHWRFVAAKLLLLNMYKEAKRFHEYEEFGYGDYLTSVKNLVNGGFYDDRLLKEYTEEELTEFAKERTWEYDYGFDYAGINLLRSRYLLKKNKSIIELPQDMYLSIALYLALPEKKEKRLEIAKKIYHIVASRKISLGTPILLNLRRPKGNLASCFITAMDDTLDSIYYTLDQVAQISKNAGGVGVNLSRIRSHGAYVKHHKGASGGVLPWIKLLNDTAVAVDQLGSRSGAVTIALDVWHKDIEDFLEMQTENGDQRKKSFDVFPQVVFSDLFMKRVEENKTWTLIDPHEIRKKLGIEIAELYGKDFETVYTKIEQDSSLEFRKTINAKDLFKRYLRTTIETGMPYAFFKDNTNNVNPNKHCGMIGNANLCVESFSNFKPTKVLPKKLSADGKKIVQEAISGEVHTCNLVSLNLMEFDDESVIKEATSLSVRILDNTIELTAPPIGESQKHNSEYRILGIGGMGLADYVVKKEIMYEDSKEIVGNLFEKIAIAGVEASIELAIEKGKYPNFEGSEWSKGVFFGKDSEWFKANSKYSDKWIELIEKVKTNGMRNGGLFAIAPNTSTSLLCGVSASILPIFKKFFIDKASNGAVPIAPPLLSLETFWKYKENQHIDQQNVINIVSEIQKWVDQGISMELVLNLNLGVTAKQIYEMYMNAWKKKCKTVYYVRSITVDANKEGGCVSCAN